MVTRQEKLVFVLVVLAIVTLLLTIYVYTGDYFIIFVIKIFFLEVDLFSRV